MDLYSWWCQKLWHGRFTVKVQRSCAELRENAAASREAGGIMTEYFRVGAVASTHGLQGEVKVFPTTDDPAKFKKLKKVYLQNGPDMAELEIAGVKFFKNMVILKFGGHGRVEDVQEYKGKDLYVPREDAVALGKDEYYIADLIGLTVFREDGTALGTLADVLQTGANDVYVVRAPGKKEILIPAIHQCVLDVDMEEGSMRVHLLDGMDDNDPAECPGRMGKEGRSQ